MRFRINGRQCSIKAELLGIWRHSLRTDAFECRMDFQRTLQPQRVPNIPIPYRWSQRPICVRSISEPLHPHYDPPGGLRRDRGPRPLLRQLTPNRRCTQRLLPLTEDVEEDPSLQPAGFFHFPQNRYPQLCRAKIKPQLSSAKSHVKPLSASKIPQLNLHQHLPQQRKVRISYVPLGKIEPED